MPIATCKLNIKQKYYILADQRWQRSNCNVSRQTWPKYELKRSLALLNMSKSDVKLLVEVMTGHAERLGLAYNDYYRLEPDEKKQLSIQCVTVKHIVYLDTAQWDSIF